MAYAHFNIIKLYSIPQAKIKQKFGKHKKEITAFAFREDGWLSTFADYTGQINLYSIKHNTIIKQFQIEDYAVHALDFLDKASTVVVGTDNGSLFVHDFAVNKSIMALPGLHDDFCRKVRLLKEGTVISAG